MKSLLLRADGWLSWMDRALVVCASAAILAMMGITFLDVFMRYALNQPLAWVYDLVTQYLLIGSFYFAFSYTLRSNENVAVDFFSRHLPAQAYSLLMCLGYGVAAVIFAAIAWLSGLDTYEAWRNNEAFMGAIVWPTWSSKIIVPIGAVALTLRLAHRCLAYAVGWADAPFQRSLGLEDNRAFVIKEH